MDAALEERANSNPNFNWSYDHDILMCREVLDIEPYQFKLRSPERGKAWESISSHLNATSYSKFRVTPRAVRDRYNLLTKKIQARLNREEKASGIEVNNSELDELLEEILEKEKAAKEKFGNDDENKKKSLENEKAATEDMRKRALERVGQTTKRKRKEEGSEAETFKTEPKSMSEAVEYLKKRASTEIGLRERELEMRKKEQESVSQREKERNEQQEKLLSTMVKQQEQQQQMMMMLLNQQQQQQSQALLSLMAKIFPK